MKSIFNSRLIFNNRYIFNNRFIIAIRNARRALEKRFLSASAKAEVSRRSKISFEVHDAVSKEMSFSYLRALSPEINENNDLYGTACNLKKYAGLGPEMSLKASIEHGLYFGSFVWQMDISNKLPCVLTFSDYRKNIIAQQTDKKIFPIGPYLHYAKGYLSATQIKEKKKSLGKNLTFFPAHSCHFEPVEENYSKLCKQLKKIARGFDSVTICVYWRDYGRGKMEIFEKNGFKCVCAGHMFDPNFLPRLKSIIELSSATASNEIGTILGYSVLMNKPHFLLDSREVKIGDLDYNYNTEKNELKSLRNEFSKYTGNITACQKNLVNLYWGLDQVKTPSQIRKLVNRCEAAFKNQK